MAQSGGKKKAVVPEAFVEVYLGTNARYLADQLAALLVLLGEENYGTE